MENKHPKNHERIKPLKKKKIGLQYQGKWSCIHHI